MQAYSVETTLSQDGTLTLSNLPLHAGESVEVIILVQPSVTLGHLRYPFVACQYATSIPLSLSPKQTGKPHSDYP